MIDDLGKLLAPLARRVGNLLARGSVTASNAAKKMQTLQVGLLAGEAKDDMEHFEPYGFTARPKAGAEVLAAFFDGDRSHGAVLVAADRRYRKTGLAEGEVALYTDEGDSIVFSRGRIVRVVAGAQLEVTAPLVTIVASTKVRMVTPLLEVTGEIKDKCDSSGKTMAGMRTTYNSHTHHENDVHGETNVPTQAM